ncbi:RNA polymerase sigma-70 factor [Chitinophaga sp. NPDC101104]|uniref:RNA polymerase sigma-70 factor n=1 Tax=Chitinophaga sp. NPDC101104 TaxID=3390561 RepID=UPI003D02CCD4
MSQPNSRDQISFEDLFRQHYSALCRIAFYVVEDEEAARDIVQDFFLYCWNKKDELVINVGFPGYAARSVKNASLNYIKRAGRISFEMTDELAETVADAADESSEAEEIRNAALWAAISRLPQQRRTVFLLSNRDGLKYADIAVQLDISINTVKTHIKLAYQFLRKECGWLVRIISILFFLK